MAGGKLVSNLRDADRPHTDLDELVPIRVERDHDLVHDARLRVAQKSGGIPLGEPPGFPLQLIIILWQRDCLANHHVIARNLY